MTFGGHMIMTSQSVYYYLQVFRGSKQGIIFSLDIRIFNHEKERNCFAF